MNTDDDLYQPEDVVILQIQRRNLKLKTKVIKLYLVHGNTNIKEVIYKLDLDDTNFGSYWHKNWLTLIMRRVK
jgi:hypothetical protein